MSSQTIFISDFSGGIRRDADAALLPDNACRDAANVVFDRHTLRVRPGKVRHTKLPDGTTLPARALFEYANAADTPAVRLLTVHGEAVYATDTGRQTFRDGESPAHVRLNTGVNAGNPVRAAQFNNELGNRLYLVDGAANVKWWEPGLSVAITGITGDGATATVTTAASHAFQTGDTVTITGNSNSGFNVSAVITRVSATSFTFASATVAAGTGGTAVSDTTVIELADRTPPAAPVHVDVNSAFQTIGLYQSGSATGQGHYMVDNQTPVWSTKDQFNPYNIDTPRCRGAAVRRLTAAANQDSQGGHTSCIALELVKDAPVGSVDFASSGYFICPVSSDTSLAYDLSQASFLRIRLNVQVEGVDLPAVGVALLESFDYNNPPADLTGWLALDLVGVAPKGWATADVELAGIDAAARDAVRFIAFKIDAAGVSTDDLSARLEFDGGVALASHTIYTLDKVCAVLLDSVTADIAAGSLQPATDYYFTCTYAYEVDGEIVESMRVAETVYRTVDDAFLVPQSLDLAAAIDTVAAPDFVYLYAYGGQLGDTWVRLAEHAVAVGETAWTHNWKGDPPGEVRTFSYGSDFANAPLAGATCIMSWNNRMCYANAEPGVGGAKDCLHVSNVNHPDQVPQEPLYDMSTVNGFWVRIGEDGQPITALAECQGQPLVFKGRGVWRVLGRDANTVAVQRLSQTHGAAVQEAVCAVGGGVVWRDQAGVWLFDGSGFRQLAPIELLQAYGFSSPEKEFAVYDPVHQLYALTNPQEPVAVSSIERAANVATVTTAAAHGLSVGDHCLIEGGTTGAFRGVVTVTGVAGYSFTYDNPGANGAAAGAYCVTGSTALVYAFKSQSWTRFTAMPGGCGRFAYQAATLGWYAADNYNAGGSGGLFRMMAGKADDGGTFDAAAIPFAWYSKLFTAPDPRVYKQVGEVRAMLSIDEPLSALTLALRINGATADTAAKEAVVESAPERPGEARWLPARQADVTRWQIGVRGHSSTGGEIPLIKVKVTAQGEY